VFDLDYQLRLVDRGGGSVSLNEYSNFRNNGNPFNFYNEDEKEDTHTPNNSLMSSLVTHTNGERLSRRGYWGDIVTGPFIPFGHAFSTKVTQFTKKINGCLD
jgi:dynein assembly factor 3